MAIRMYKSKLGSWAREKKFAPKQEKAGWHQPKNSGDWAVKENAIKQAKHYQAKGYKAKVVHFPKDYRYEVWVKR